MMGTAVLELSEDSFQAGHLADQSTQVGFSSEKKRRIIGNRADLTDLYRQSRTTIWDKKVYQVFNVVEDTANKSVELTIMNLWRMVKCKGHYWFEEFDLSEDAWKYVPLDHLINFPYFNVYPITKDLGYIQGIVNKAVRKIAIHHGYNQIPEHCVGSSLSTLSKERFLCLIQTHLRKVIGRDNLDIKAKLLRSLFYAHFYERDVIKALMSVNYKYVGFFNYIRCLLLKTDFFRVVNERKNLLPVLLEIDSKYWSRMDIFSKKIWCAKTSQMPLCVTNSFSSRKSKSFYSFSNVSVFRWLFSQKTTIIRTWIKHRHADLEVLKQAIESASKPPATYAICALMERVQGNISLMQEHTESMTFLFKAFLNESNAVWESAGYTALRKWVPINAHRMASVFDYLRVEGFAAGVVHKKSTWVSVNEKSEEWHTRKARERDARKIAVHMNRQSLKWNSLINEIDINHVKFTAVTTYPRLYEEAVNMHHCVDSYLEMCLENCYRVFHVDDNRGNTATLGISFDYHGRHNDSSWSIDQIQAPCNQMPAKPIVKTCKSFLKTFNELWKERNF